MATRRKGMFGCRNALFAAALLATAARACPATPATPAIAIGQGEDIDWRTSPLDLNLRGLNGERFRFQCPAGKPAAGEVMGSGPYTDGSSICAAAVHAGMLTASTGGPVAIEVRPGQAHYSASLSHFVQSQAYDAFWSGSFLIVPLNVIPGNGAAGPEPARPISKKLGAIP